MSDIPLGILAYAGQNADTLLTKARMLLNEHKAHMPPSFCLFLPVFPAELVINQDYVRPGHFELSPQAYHERLYQRSPSLYGNENLIRCIDAKGHAKPFPFFTMDAHLCESFPQFEPFLGEACALYPIGSQITLVPSRLYPRNHQYLRFLERTLGIDRQVKAYLVYVKTRTDQGEPYDAIQFARAYLRQEHLTPCTITQNALARAMQGHSILQSLTHPQNSLDFFTSYAKKAQQIPQYEPSLRACDIFELKKVNRATARLLQLSFHENDPLSDFWLPYEEASQYIDHKQMILDVSSLCKAFQLPPCYDPTMGTALYPSFARMVVVRDHSLPLMVASTTNNPAYGTGMNQHGKRHSLVYLTNSEKQVKLRKIVREPTLFTTTSTPITSSVYAQMLTSTYLQELKGNWIDALYCRHCALHQIKEGTAQYQFAKETFTVRVDEIAAKIAQTSATIAPLPFSGYDADIDYLQRMWHNQEDGQVCKDMPSPTVPFATDVLRTMSIECGYAMRNCLMSTCREVPSFPHDQQGGTENDPQRYRQNA